MYVPVCKIYETVCKMYEPVISFMLMFTKRQILDLFTAPRTIRFSPLLWNSDPNCFTCLFTVPWIEQRLCLSIWFPK